MRIKNIHISKENLDLVRPYTIAFKTISSVENFFVEIELENGLKGHGAGNPSQAVTGENFEESYQKLKSLDWDWLIGSDIREVNRLSRKAQENLRNRPAALAAVDIALHDLFTLYLDVPLAKYLGQHFHELPTSITIGIKNVEETLEEATEYMDRKFTHLKVKLGHSLEEDLERLFKLREKYADRIQIRVDANQGYTLEELKIFLEKAASLKLELVEQPLPAKAIDELLGLPEQARYQLAADESLLEPESAQQLVKRGSPFGIFNIKLMKCGGIRTAKMISDTAESNGLRLMWGCNDESRISIAAALHLAFSCPNTRFIDLDGSLDLALDCVEGGFRLKDGMMSLLDAPGLGVRSLSDTR